LSSIVKVVIEKVGTSVVGTEVSLKSADISLKEGRATLKGLDIANPDGFSRSSMIYVGEMTAQLEAKTGVIKEIYIGSPQIRFEQKGKESNFSVVQRNLESEPSEPEPKEAAEAKELQIDFFKLEKAEVTVTSDQFEGEKKLLLEEITFKNLKGTPSAIGREVMGQLVGKIIVQVTKDVLGSAVKGALKEKAGGLFPKRE
jgi:uncharacterized protein involved in outer membrane biogenesis